MVYNFSSDEEPDDGSIGAPPNDTSTASRKSSPSDKSCTTNKSADDTSTTDAPTEISPTNSDEAVEVNGWGSDDDSVVVVATKKAKNFTMFQWWFLFKAYVRVSEDATQGTDRRADSFWKEVEKCFCHQVSKYVHQYPMEKKHFHSRKPEQLRLQYATRLQPQLNKWFKVVKKIPYVSGTDKEQLYARRLDLYKQDKNACKHGKVLLYLFTQKLQNGRMVDLPAYAEEHPKWRSFTEERLTNGQGGDEVTVVENPKSKRPAGAKAEAAMKKARKSIKLEAKSEEDTAENKSAGEPFLEMLTKTFKDTSVVVEQSVKGQQERENKEFSLRQERQHQDFVLGLLDRFSKMNDTDKGAIWEPLTTTMKAVVSTLASNGDATAFSGDVAEDTDDAAEE